MNDIRKSARVNNALQVFQNMNNGMTVVKTCEIVGLPRSSFDYILQNNPEAIIEI